MDKENKSDVKFIEKFSIKFRKIIIVNKLLTILIVAVLVAAFIGLNMWIKSMDLSEIDVTANKIYTLSDESKKAISNINQDIKIYVYGIGENDSIVGLIKQYCNANDKISYEMLSEESNLAKVQEFELESGYSIVVIESGSSKKIIDASTEFQTYDYTNYSQIDITEQTLTNSILGLTVENKPKVYFVSGHEEFSLPTEENSQAELGVLATYLKNESFEVKQINLMTAGSVPEDCSVLAIMSPSIDYMESETNAILDYINKGGNLFITQDLLSEENNFVNLNNILAVYGVSVDNGYILEKDSNKIVSNTPAIFMPVISNTNGITSDISTDSFMWLAYSKRLKFLPSEQLTNLNVTYEELLSSSDSSLFITDFSSDAEVAAKSAQTGKNIISALVTKKIVLPEATKESKLVIVADGRFITDYVITELSSQYPLSYFGGNKDFVINSMAVLSNKENGLTLRKEIAGTSYVFSATEIQNRIVLAIIFVVPVLIIIIGIIIWKHRKKRK